MPKQSKRERQGLRLLKPINIIDERLRSLATRMEGDLTMTDKLAIEGNQETNGKTNTEFNSTVRRETET